MRENEGAFRSTLDKLSDLPIVGDIRGAGYFYGIELVQGQDDAGELQRTTNPSGSCGASSRLRSSRRG